MLEAYKSRALLVDLYELTMAAGFFEHRIECRATFELFVRQLPPERAARRARRRVCAQRVPLMWAVVRAPRTFWLDICTECPLRAPPHTPGRRPFLPSANRSRHSSRHFPTQRSC